MRQHNLKLATAVAAALVLAVGGVAYASTGQTGAANGVSRSTQQRAAAAAGHGVDTVAREGTEQVDTDNVQAGDQTGPDGGTATGVASGLARPNSGDPNEADQAEGGGSEASNNDGAGGHADEPGNPNADHQFQGVE